jgi:two-component system phosphate regulon sensor histidine kinase PhoR
VKNNSSKLILIVVGTILLPIVLYVIFEISSISEGEEMIDKVYTEQLDAIIFSVNQYSTDNMEGVLSKIGNHLDSTLQLKGDPTFLYFSNFKLLFFQDENSQKSNYFLVEQINISETEIIELQDSLFNEADMQKSRKQLLRYLDGGYRKIEPKGTIVIGGEKLQVVHAVLQIEERKIYFTGLLSINGFANDVLAPRLQQIAQEDLVISLTALSDGEILYQTDTLDKTTIFKKRMWLFPDMEVGITSKKQTVKELVDERMTKNLVAAGILITLLISGFILIIRNFKREMILVQTKSDFVSNVSHELRTPLSLISMFAETLYLDRVKSQEKRKEYEEIILKETNRLTNIVNKILNFSQIEANKRTYHPTVIDPNEVLKELLHDYSFHIQNNGFTFSQSLEDQLPKTLLDKEALYEALVNLTDNAIKYSEDKKHLNFLTGHRDDKVFVEVTDQGIGIKPDKIHQIFDKFYRVTDGNVQTTRGAGLGLALVHHIVEAHEGDIEVESKIGEGSTFRLVFKAIEDVENTHS